MTEHNDGGTMFVGGLIAGALIVAAGYGISLDRSLWLNDTGLAEIVVGLGTLAVVVAGAFQANRSYWVNRSAAHSTRFKDAAELLDRGTASTHAGIALTAEVASENPAVYGMAAVKALFAVSQKAEAPKRVNVSFDDLNRGRVNYAGRLPDSELVSMEAFATAARLVDSFDLTASAFVEDVAEGRVMMPSLYFAGYTLAGARLSNLNLSWSVLYRATFREVTFRNVVIHGCFAGKVTFENCKFEGLKLYPSDRNGNKLQSNSLYAPRFHGGQGIETVLINETHATDWVKLRIAEGTQWGPRIADKDGE